MSAPLRLLTVEDSEDDALLLVRNLRQGGYELAYKRVETAESMSAALDEQEWDIIISDYVMPQFSGLHALKVMQDRGLDLPFIIVSGKIGEDIAVEAMKAGAHDYVLKDNLARLVPAVGRELHEAKIRQERKLAEEHKREFYRRTIVAATEGKLVIAERDEIDRIAGESTDTFQVNHSEDISDIRKAIARIAGAEGMEESRVHDFSVAVGEAAANAFKHAGGGIVSVHKLPDALMVVVSDCGPGIEAMTIPKVALERGYTTAGTLGMGYKIIIAVADRVHLATGPGGTTVGIEIMLRPSAVDAALDRIIQSLPETT